MASFQDILRKGVFSLGKAVESIAGRIPAAKSKKKHRTNKSLDRGSVGSDTAPPQLPWDSHHIQTLLSGAERSHLFALIPDLAQKSVLHLTPGSASFVSMLEKRQAARIIECDVRKSAVKLETVEGKSHPYVRAALDKLPFANESFDFVLYPSALEWRLDLPQGIAEVGRCIRANGRFLLSTVHPFFEYLSDPKRGFRKSLGNTFAELKKVGLFVEELEEISLGEALRLVSVPASLQEELRSFHSIPMLLLIRSIQVRKRK